MGVQGLKKTSKYKTKRCKEKKRTQLKSKEDFLVTGQGKKIASF